MTAPSRPQPDSMIGRLIVDGRIRILERIGRGGMGSVYKAEQLDIGRAVAVKVLHGGLALRPDLTARFRREARAMSQLHHPNTVQILLYGELSTREPYIVMEYLEGRTLAALVRENPIPVERAIPLLLQACGSVAEAHALGMLHRDLKPENLFVTARHGLEDFLKVLDFGLARLGEQQLGPESATLTATGAVFGTPQFMAPEQTVGAPLDARSDLYSLAVILYEALTGKLPFDGSSPSDYLRLHLTEPPIPLSRRAPQLKFPPGLWSLLERALEKQRSARPATVREFAEALAAFAPPTEPSRAALALLNRPTAPELVGANAAAPRAAPEQSSPWDDSWATDAPTVLSGEHPRAVAPNGSATQGVALRSEAATLPDSGQLGRSGLDGFELQEEIGRGGMGVVYRARQRALQREVAVKMVSLPDPQAAQRFVAEAVTTAGLEHPNIVPVYDFQTDGAEPRRAMLAMKLVGGQSWQTLLYPPEGSGLVTPDFDAHLSIWRAVANAVAFAHSRHVLHCDLKPDNVLVGAYGEVLLVDWGLALSFAPSPDPAAPLRHVSQVRGTIGTPRYMPPELALAKPEQLGVRSDVFLLGGLLHELLLGRPPHDGETFHAVVLAAVDYAGPDFRDSEVPPGFGPILRRAMAPAPADRYGTVAELIDAVEDARHHQESLKLALSATRQLASCAERADRGERGSSLYTEFTEAASTFARAAELWPQNRRATEGELTARLWLATAATGAGDLGLARSTLSRLPTTAPGVPEAFAALERAEHTRNRDRWRAAAARWALAGSLLVGALGGILFTLRLREEARRTTAAAALAEQRLDAVTRLSDTVRVEQLVTEDGQLWPAVPVLESKLTGWLERATELGQRLPQHKTDLEALRRRAVRRNPHWFATLEEQWEHDTLARLVGDIESLLAQRIPKIEARLASARTLGQRSLAAKSAEWTRAASAVASSPRYGGLQLKPMLGLVPLGPDPDSGLEEFAHLPSGNVPSRGPDGRLQLTEQTGIVLVLLPAGRFRMGAARPAAGARGKAGTGPNLDPSAGTHEGPVHELALDAFLIGKYEVTQAQWVRVMDRNPAAYPPGKQLAGKTHTSRHPIEMVLHEEALTAMHRYGLTLPTEAQWEYAHRAGTSTIYFTGDTLESLTGYLNIADRWGAEHDGPGSWPYELQLNDGYLAHAPVGSFRPNGFGLHDTSGNVWEWCLDQYGAYTLPTEPGTGARLAPPNSANVFRGGGFRANRSHARVADRYSLYAPDYRGYDIGFRAARRLDR